MNGNPPRPRLNFPAAHPQPVRADIEEADPRCEVPDDRMKPRGSLLRILADDVHFDLARRVRLDELAARVRPDSLHPVLHSLLPREDKRLTSTVHPLHDGNDLRGLRDILGRRLRRMMGSFFFSLRGGGSIALVI